jgi:hypothetical protein
MLHGRVVTDPKPNGQLHVWLSPHLRDEADTCDRLGSGGGGGVKRVELDIHVFDAILV